jgi:hypothetical protein
MKKNIITFFIIFIVSALQAQELTVEYNFGYGKYCMRDLRSFLSENNSFSSGRELENLKVTDNFPGNWMHQLKLGVELKRSHNIGVSIDFMNTAGQKALSDYSGSYNFTYRTNGKRMGLYYRISPYSWFPGIIQPYFMLTAGVVFNDNRIVEKFIVYDELILDEKMSLKGIGSFAEPSLGCKIRLHENFALNLNIGYHFDFGRVVSEYDVKKSSVINTIDAPIWGGNGYDMPAWGGLRFQGGVVFYLLRK